MKTNIIRTITAVAAGLLFTFGSFEPAQALNLEAVKKEVIEAFKESGLSQEEAKAMSEEMKALFAAVIREDMETIESLALEKGNPCAQVMLALSLAEEDEEKAGALVMTALIKCRLSRKYAPYRVAIKYILQDVDIDIDELEKELLNN